MLDLFTQTSAVFSDDKLHRYELRRVWNSDKPLVNWLMLNPSTADENIDDPTVAKTQKFSHMWGYGGVIVTNLFAYRATDPQEMKAYPDPIGELNDEYIIKAARESGLILCSWGNHGLHLNRSKHVVEMLLNDPYLNQRSGVWLWCLETNKTGEPKHPLYVALKTKPSGYHGMGKEPNPILI